MVVSASASQRGSPPIPRTRLIGREDERSTARAFLLDESVPLLTLVGPGGVGKTRLALAIAGDVAPHFSDGVLWVDLAPLTDPESVASTVAAALEIRPGPDHPVMDAIAAQLRSAQVLMLLDNCEHLLESVGALVATLLAACPALQVLATSRAPLRVRGEQILPTPPLAMPRTGSPLHEMRTAPAAELFAQRAQAVDPHFALTEHNADAVTRVCQRLDGLPLAIELAAARSNLLSPAALLALLNQRLQVLATGPRDAPARHQTLQEAIAWSYDLLTPDEQASFRCLAVFAGGWSLEAAAAVTGLQNPDALARLDALVDQSLVAPRIDANASAPRFTMLETIRAFALEQLAASGAGDAARDDHAAYFIALTDDTTDSTPPEMAAQDSAGVSWDQRIRMENANIRAAMMHLIETGNGQEALQLSLSTAWFAAATSQEGRLWLEWSLAHTPTSPSIARGLALAELAYVRWAQGAYAEAQELADASRAIAEHLNDAKVAPTPLTSSGPSRSVSSTMRWRERT